jgi:hypothetical protein
VFVFDGDGALWMNLGSLATIGLHQPKNLIHICWDNHQYESSGGEPTAATADNLDFAGVARSAGIKSSRTAITIESCRVRESRLEPRRPTSSARASSRQSEALRCAYDELETSTVSSAISKSLKASAFCESQCRELFAMLK